MLTERIPERHTGGCQCIDIRRPNQRIAVAPNAVRPQLIRQNKHNVLQFVILISNRRHE